MGLRQSRSLRKNLQLTIINSEFILFAFGIPASLQEFRRQKTNKNIIIHEHEETFFHLLTFVCAGFTLLLAPGCNDDEGEKTGPTGDEGKEIYSLSVTPDKLEFQSTKQTVEVTVTTNGPYWE